VRRHLFCVPELCELSWRWTTHTSCTTFFCSLDCLLERPPSPFLDLPVFFLPQSTTASCCEDMAWADVVTDPDRIELLHRIAGTATTPERRDSARKIREHLAGTIRRYNCPSFERTSVWIGHSQEHRGMAVTRGRVSDRFDAMHDLEAAGWSQADMDTRSSLALAWATEVLFPHCVCHGPVEKTGKSIGAKVKTMFNESSEGMSVTGPQVSVESRPPSATVVRVRMWLCVPHVKEKLFLRSRELLYGTTFVCVNVDFTGAPPKINVTTQQIQKTGDFPKELLGKLADVTAPEVSFKYKKRFALAPPKLLKKELEVNGLVSLGRPSKPLDTRTSQHSIHMGRPRSVSFSGVSSPRVALSSGSARAIAASLPRVMASSEGSTPGGDMIPALSGADLGPVLEDSPNLAELSLGKNAKDGLREELTMEEEEEEMGPLLTEMLSLSRDRSGTV